MLGQRIQRARKGAGLTPDALAEKLNVSKRTLGYYEAGEREPTATACALIAELCSIPISWLLTGEGSPDGSGDGGLYIGPGERDIVEQLLEIMRGAPKDTVKQVMGEISFACNQLRTGEIPRKSDKKKTG